MACKEAREGPEAEVGVMTADQVAAYLQVSLKTIRNWTSAGRIPSTKIFGVRRYEKSALDRLVVAGRQHGSLDRPAKTRPHEGPSEVGTT